MVRRKGIAILVIASAFAALAHGQEEQIVRQVAVQGANKTYSWARHQLKFHRHHGSVSVEGISQDLSAAKISEENLDKWKLVDAQQVLSKAQIEQIRHTIAASPALRSGQESLNKLLHSTKLLDANQEAIGVSGKAHQILISATQR